MADKEPTTTVDDGSLDHDESEASSTGFSFDEQTLGRSTSVFDAGVDLTPPAVPPTAPPLAGYNETAGPYDDDYGDQYERELTNADRRRRVRLEARRVRRVVRHIEPWSVLKISILFYLCLWLIFLLAGVLLWSFAKRTDTLAEIENLVETLFALKEENEFWSGGTIFRIYAFTTMVFSIAGVTFNVLLAVLYNLISDLTGGLRLTVIEEETARFAPPQRRARR